MVGLKTFWITLSALFILSACVPQTKQTSCKSNEAFNSALRTCVPVVGGTDSFVNIDDYVPHYTVTKSKADYSNVDFSITISNPYGTNYTIQWERVFNGTPEVIPSSTNATSVSLMPAYLGTTLGQIGTHIITAKIIANSVIVDSHSFELKINELPKPTINNATVLPVQNVYTFTYTPLDGVQNFGFTIKNNADLDQLANWKTTWTVTKNGASYPSLNDVDTFTTFQSTTTNSTYLGDSPATQFNPSVVGIGSYVIRAVVSNDSPGEVVDERTWYVTVKYPDLPKITSRNIYRNLGTPSFSTVVNAYNSISYNLSPTYNFVPSTVSVPAVGAQADFCVTIADGDGTFPGGGGVRVDYYLDGVTLIHSGSTSSSNNKICLTDTVDPSNIVFSNPSSTTTVNHTIQARLVDEDSNIEYTNSDINAGLGTYPVTWNISVRPDNAAPVVAFTATSNLSGLTCGTASGNSKTCSVSQDTPFVLGVKATDEFYDTSSTADAQQGQLAYSMVLYRNGSAISTCKKEFSDVADTTTPGADFVGPDYLCQFTVPSFDANGPVNPTAYSYSVAITVSDAGSPISGSTGKTSTTFTYNLSPVAEVNTAPTIGPQGTTVADTHLANAATPGTVIESSANPAHYITEGETLNFNILVSDQERDHHQIVVSLCTDASCAVANQIVVKNVTKTDSSLTTMSSLSYLLPEDIIPVATPLGTNVPVYFKISVTDSTSTLGTGLTATPIVMSVNVRNKNAAPVIGGTPVPALATALTAMVGYPLTIDPGTVTDASIVTAENTIGYQWYVDPTGAGNAFAAITGATARRLTWTPSNALAASTVNLRLCVHDNTAVNPLPTGAAIGTTGLNATNGPNCIGNWNVTVRKNAVALQGSTANADPDVAIWQDTTVSGKRVVYSAYSDNANIYVNKTVFSASGVIYNDASSGFQVVSFEAIPGGNYAGSIKDISITGTADYLFIAYQAANPGTPNSPRIKVRKINKSTSNGTKTSATYPDLGKFGYSYTQSLPGTNSSSVTITATAAGDPYEVDFTGALATGSPDRVVVNGIPFEAASPELPDSLCGGGGSCSPDGNAIKLASLINSSSDRALQGLTARVDSSDTSKVIIEGATGGQNLDSNTAVNSYVTGKLGKIVTDGTDWYLPFVDMSTVGAINQIRVLSAPVTSSLNASTAVSNGTILTAVGTVTWFENELNNANQLVIGSITTTSRANLHVYNLGGTIVSSKALFSGSPVDASSVRISSTKSGNPYYYAVAKVLTTLPSTYEWKIGRYDASLVTSVEDKFSSLALNAATTNVLDDDEVIDITLAGMPSAVSSTEARLLVTSKAGGTDVNLYAVRFRSDNKLSCGLCTQVNTSPQVLSSANRVAMTSIDMDMTIGTSGANPNENQKDVFFSIFAVDEDGVGGVNSPNFGIFNAETESINSTSTDTTGTLGHRPPFFGAN